jgi:hypothetical protein
MKNSTITKIGIAVTGALLLGWVVLELMSSGPKKTNAVKTEEDVCPECGTRLSKSGDCLKCIGEMGADAYRAKKEASEPSAGRLIPIVLVSLLGMLIAVHVGLVVRSRVGKKKDDVLYYFWCPKCRRKLRYREAQIGKASQCPICKRPFLFPKPEEEPKEPFFRALSGRLRQFFSLRTPQE